MAGPGLTTPLLSSAGTSTVLNKGVVTPGAPITVPGYLTFLLTPRPAPPRVAVEAQQLLSFAAVDPPSRPAAAKIQVIAIGGGLIYASAS